MLKEYPIDAIIEIENELYSIKQEFSNTCRGCAFYATGCTSKTHFCSRATRDDGKEIHYIKIDVIV